jgi:hypothetical protein
LRPSACARSRVGPGSSPTSRRRRRSLCRWVARAGPTSAGPARTASVRRIEPRSTSRPRLHRWTDRENAFSGDPFADCAPRCRQGLCASAIDEKLIVPTTTRLIGHHSSSGLLMSWRRSRRSRPRAQDLFLPELLATRHLPGGTGRGTGPNAGCSPSREATRADLIRANRPSHPSVGRCK